MNKATRLRIGVIGLGRRGQEHLSTITAMTDRYHLAAVCDLSHQVAQATAASVGVKGYSNIAEFFGQVDLDVVVIATPRDTHHLVAKNAADHRVHMLIETPLAPTRRMMDFICQVVDRAGVKAEVGENMWRRPSEQLARKALDAGLIGNVLRVSSYYDDAGGNSCYHTVSRMRRFAGADVEEVIAYSQTYKGILPVRFGAGTADEETWTQAILFLSNGVTGTCTYVTNWVSPLRGGHPRFMSVEGTDGFIVTGRGSPNVLRRVENGVAFDYPVALEHRHLNGEELPMRFYYGTHPEVEFINPFHDRILDSNGPDCVWDGIARADELESLYHAVVRGEEPNYGLARARRDQEISIMITESARLGHHPISKLSEDEETVWEREVNAAFQRRWGMDPFKDVKEFRRWGRA